MNCLNCNDTGSLGSGNNDLPCDCSAGDTALFTQAGVRGQVTGRQIKRHFQNNSPEPIRPPQQGEIDASSLPS